MITIRDIPHLKLYKQKVYLPVNEKSPSLNSMILFNNMDIDWSLEFLSSPNIMLTNSKYYTFYIDRMYNEKIRNKTVKINYTKDREVIYERINEEYKFIKTALNENQLMKRNCYYDLSVYNKIFFDNIGSVSIRKKIEEYFKYLNKLFNKAPSNYNNKVICMNVDKWFNQKDENNPIIYFLISSNKYPDLLSLVGDLTIILYGKAGVIRLHTTEFNKNNRSILKREVGKLVSKNINDEIEDDESIKDDEIDNSDNDVSDTVVVNNISTDNISDPDIKEEVEQKLEDNKIKYFDSELSDKEVDQVASDDTNNDVELIQKVDSLLKEKKVGKSTASLKRDEELRKRQKEIRLQDTTLDELLNLDISEFELPVVDVSDKVVTTNPNVTKVRFNQFDKEYNEKLFHSDTTKILTQLNDLDLKVYVKDIKIEDSSDSLNYKDTYRIILEDENRVRHSLTFDVPKFIDDRYLYINGNKKIINKQLFIKPIAKTGPDEVQVCSNYNKIFIYRYGRKYSPKLEKFKKIITSPIAGLSITNGDASEINRNYKSILEYDILSESIVSLKTREFELNFNQSEIQEVLGTYKLKDDEMCIGFWKDGKPITMSYNTEKIGEYDIVEFIVMNGPEELRKRFEDSSISTKTFAYSRASIMNNKVPLILLLAYCEGISKVLSKANIKYYFTDKRPVKNDNEAVIQFADGYLVYDRYPYENSLLMNGLTTIPTKAFSYTDFDEKELFVDLFGELYGARNLANAFDTFYEFMIDPITKEILEELDYPTDFVSVLLAANGLLADNGYIPENNMNLYRVRSNEVVNALIHKELAKAYSAYRATAGNTNPTKISIKKDAIIKELMQINTVEEHSVLNPIYEIEKAHTISVRGLSGMNLSESFTQDKRAYSDTMLGVIGMSTSPDGNVGVARKLTMEPNIKGHRGFIDIKKDDLNSLNDVNLFTAAEMLTPMGVSHDDAIRTAIK